MRILIFGLVLLCAPVMMFAETEEFQKATELYLLPLEVAGSGQQDSFQEVVFRSLYTFMRIIPSLNVPEEQVLNDLFWTGPVLKRWERIKPETAPKIVYNADIIVYGDYEMGDKDTALVQIGVWSKKENRNIFQKKYRTSTGIEVFDSVDVMLKDIVQDVLHLSFSIARISFNIKTGGDRFNVLINGKQVYELKGQAFNSALSVLGGQTYRVQVVRARDGRIVYEQTHKLIEGQTAEVEYTARGTLRVNPIAYGRRGEVYTTTLDGVVVPSGGITTNVSALQDHIIRVTDAKSNEVYQETAAIRDGQENTISPTLSGYSPWHWRAYTMGGSMIGAGLRYFPDRYFYLEGGSGFSFYQLSSLNTISFELSPYLQAGYYIWGDMTEEWRALAGLRASYSLLLNAPDATVINPVYLKNGQLQGSSAMLWAFGAGEWRFVHLELALGYSLTTGNISFAPALGVVF